MSKPSDSLREESNTYSSSDTESETSSANTEAQSTTIKEVDNLAPVTQPELPLMSFLKRVFKEAGSFAAAEEDSRLLTVAVHGVMLQSGFICYVPESNTKINGFQLPKRFVNLVNYTLPEAFERGSTKIDSVGLNFHDSENSLNIEGSLSDNTEPVVHQLSLSRSRFAPLLDIAFVNSDMIDTRIRIHGSSSDQYPENEVIEFHRLVSDALAYPLLIELCQTMSLLPPPCFMRLSSDLKLKILEHANGVDIARAACASSELRNLSADDDLWKRKCEELLSFRIRLPRGNCKYLYALWHANRKNKS